MVRPGETLRINYTGYESSSLTVQESHLAVKDTEIELILPTALLGEVIVAGGLALTAVSDYTVDVQPDTAEEEADGFFRSVRISPNPFTDRLNVSFRAGDAVAVKATLHTVDGLVVRTWPEYRFAAGKVKVELPLGTTDVPTGSYILRLLDQSEVLHSAVVIKK